MSAEFEALAETIENETHVVVAVSPILARSFLQDSKQLYQGYEKLVEGGSRTPAPQEFDSQRYAVAGKLFGHYAEDIRYGLLSINGRSLKNYGIVHIQLRDIAIKDRVSFLHENSYLFVREFDLKPDSPLPVGYRCSWLNKKELVAAKLESSLVPGSGKEEWARLLVNNGETRDRDQCVEAHIYGPFNSAAIENIEYENNGFNRQDRLDIEIIKDIFGHKKVSGWPS
ncbi:hypothetical protein [Geothrix campi]|uniref:hypothetical protein n=1 Tax=Geothrix campi TaxID=2966450 RepID=UPI0021498BB2|nr:hypothetical protein [Geothrix sp. SG10]